MSQLYSNEVNNGTVTSVNAGNNISITGPANAPIVNVFGTTPHAIQVGNTLNGALTSLTVATDGQLPIGSTGADPVIANLTAGGGIAIVNGPGTITISSTGSGFPWTEINAASVNLANNNGYIMNRATLITATLPLTASVGDSIAIVGTGVGGWLIAQNAGQTIHYISVSTSAGVLGSLSSLQRWDCVEIICIGMDTDWVVRTSVGNLTVV